MNKREESKLIELNDSLLKGEQMLFLKRMEMFAKEHLLRKQYCFHVIDIIRYVISCLNYTRNNNCNNSNDNSNDNIPPFSVATSVADYFLREPKLGASHMHHDYRKYRNDLDFVSSYNCDQGSLQIFGL